MSLAKEGFIAATKRLKKLQKRVEKLSAKFNPPFNNLDKKVHMDHYGFCYLFGKRINEDTADLELIEIIKQTPEEEYDGRIGFFGEWCIGDCSAVVERYNRLQVRINALFVKLGLNIKDKVMKDISGNIYLFGKPINESMTDDELVKIINDTPEDNYDGVTNEFSGAWILWECKAVVERRNEIQARVNGLFQELGLIFESEDIGKIGADHAGNLYLFGKLVTGSMTNDELIKIIKETPESERDGYMTYDSKWIVRQSWD